MAAGSETGQELAIVGMSGRFAGADDLGAFWSNLEGGVESIRRFTEEELRSEGVDPKLLSDPMYVRALGYIDGVDRFDADFFQIPAAAAETIDPQQRALIECSWAAMEDAGYVPGQMNRPAAVYAGVGPNVYLLFNKAIQRDLHDPHLYMDLIVGNDKDYAANRIAYKLGLTGPACSVQTACSTGLVAIHLAGQSLVSGETDLAIAAGAYFPAIFKQGYMQREGGKTSPDGHVRSFDAKAAGTVFGSGVAALVLKRLSDALADGDHIHAVVKGTAVNNDGATKVGYTVPTVDGQAAAMADALAVAGVEPGSVSYIEAHATGTAMGDSIELLALSKAYGARIPSGGRCALGSVKSNIGHCSVAGALSGLIKTVLCMQHGKLVPTLHFERPQPDMNLAGTPFYVNTQVADWVSNGSPRRAAVNATGYGGTNAHVILEESPLRPDSPRPRGEQLLILSAKTPEALDSAARRLADHLRRRPSINLTDVAFTLQVGRKAFACRRAVIASDAAQAAEALSDPGRALGARASGLSDPAGVMAYLLELSKAGADAARARAALEGLGMLWSSGADVDWSRLYAGEKRRRVPLPSYPFQRKRYHYGSAE